MGAWIARIAGLLGLVSLALAALALFYLNSYVDAPVDPAWAIEASGEKIPSGAVTVRYTADSLEKGQRSWNAIKIVGQLLLGKLRR